MKHPVRTAVSAAALSVVLAFAAAPAARGQVAFEGDFRVGSPYFAVGSYVPGPWASRVYYRPAYGYGFACDAGWVPVRSFHRRWIVIGRPVAFYGRFHPYRFDGRFRWHDGYRRHGPYRYRW